MSNRDWMAFSRTAVAAAVAAVSVMAVAPALAQNTTAGIGGRITGTDGQPAAGAAVTIVHVESGSTSNLVTDAEGRYAARGLRAGGPYTITITRGGQSERRDNVFLNLAETLALDAQLGTPTAAQTITITGRGLNDKFNASNMGAGTAISSRDLNTFASIQRNLQDYARTDPRLSQTDKERGEISMAGQNTRFNSITIDGVTTNDTFGLEANNLPTIKQPISIDAIQSVQVNISNYDVTQKGYTGANINAVTKSGTNQFRGSVYYVFRDDDLAGKRYNRTTDSYFDAPKFKDDTIGFTLGGPIIADKLFFFGSYERFKSSRTSPAFGPLGSALTNVGITQTAIDRAIGIAGTTYGFDAGTSTIPEGLAVEVKDTLFKLDWNINDNHRASLRYTKTEQDDPQLNGFTASGLALSSWFFNQTKTVESVVGQWFADWSDNFSTEFKISKRDYDSVPVLFGQRLPAVGLRFAGAIEGNPAGVNSNNRFLNFGTENSRHLNVLRTETLDIYGGATLTLGGHELKFGADHQDNEIYNAFLQNINGNYTFACEPGTYSFGVIPATGQGCNTAGITQAQRDLAVLENFQRGLPSAYTLQYAQPNRTIDDAISRFTYKNTGLFLQDTFKLSPALSLMAGVRVDRQSVPERPLFNAAAAAPRTPGTATATAVTTRDTGGFGFDNQRTLDGNTLVQPRLGFNWKLPSERRAQLRGGVGLFQGTAANVWLSNPFSNTGQAVTTFNCNTFQACNGSNTSTAATTSANRFTPNPDAQPRPGSTVVSQPNVDFLSPDLEQPSTWKANIAFDMELPTLPVVGGLTFSAEYLRLQTKDAIYYQSLNIGGATASTGPDGRPLFYTPQTYNPACWNGGSTFITTGSCTGGRNRALSNAAFNNAYLARNTDKGYANSLTLSLGKPTPGDGLGWSVGYTRTSAKEVSPLTSSTSGSNFGNRNIFDPNEEVLQNSNYLVRDRFTASASWSKAFVSDYRTTVGLFYEGRKGKPYSWTYINDMNGDSVGGNDLMYVPRGIGSGEVIFREANSSSLVNSTAAEAAFFEVVESNKTLRNAKGGVVGRNDTFAPFVNNVDMRISQQLPGFWKNHKTTFALDILNLGNLLNKKWGRIDEISFPSNRSFVNFNGLDSQGRYVYAVGTTEDFTTRQASGESQWAIQATLRYEF